MFNSDLDFFLLDIEKFSKTVPEILNNIVLTRQTTENRNVD